MAGDDRSLRQFIKRLLCAAQDHHTPRSKQTAGMGGPYLPRGAHQQTGPHIVFELGDLLTHHRLGKASGTTAREASPEQRFSLLGDLS